MKKTLGFTGLFLLSLVLINCGGGSSNSNNSSGAIETLENDGLVPKTPITSVGGPIDGKFDDVQFSCSNGKQPKQSIQSFGYAISNTSGQIALVYTNNLRVALNAQFTYGSNNQVTVTSTGVSGCDDSSANAGTTCKGYTAPTITQTGTYTVNGNQITLNFTSDWMCSPNLSTLVGSSATLTKTN